MLPRASQIISAGAPVFHRRLTLLVAFVVVLAGCASQPPPVETAPGFIAGLLHGFVGPFALVVSLFNSEVRVYAFPNTGVLYDLGFLLGLSVWGGGAAAGAARGEYENRDDEVDDAQNRIRRLRRKVRRLQAENWELRNRGQS